MKRFFFFSFLVFSFFVSFSQYTKKVNPFVGTDEHGHTYPGAIAPFGMVQLSPDTRLGGWDGCSGYHYSDSIIYGFSHTHLSGTGCEDLCDILFTPTIKDEKAEDFRSKFSHQSEKAFAGYYYVELQEGVVCDFTATQRVGYHRYKYSDKAQRIALVIDMLHRDKTLEWNIEIIDKQTIVGYRNSKSWAEEQKVYFAAKFNRPIIYSNLNQEKGKLYLEFANNDKNLEAKVSLSSVDYIGALKNLNSEEYSFEEALNENQRLWNSALGVIEIEGGTEAEQRTFYTSLYHCMISPTLYSDIDGKYRGMYREKIEGERMANNIFVAKDYDRYTTFSLWDTYRTLNPLMTIINPEICKDFAKTFKDIYLQFGELPMWELHSWETYCMIGAHGVSVLAEWIMKDIIPADEVFLQSMLATVNKDKRGLNFFHENGYISSEQEHESVSKTVEYAYNMYCIALVAKKMGKQDLYSEYISKAQYYKNLFNPKNTFIQPKENGRFSPNFDPKQVDINYTEGNGWHYTFYAPQDVNTMVDMMGGDEKFDKKLDQCFYSKEATTGRQQVDVTGLIGQYAHGNEPSQHTAYLYNYIGKPYKTQKLVRQILSTLYSDKPDGVCGNDDCGQMAAWYVMSALGIYPVSPVSGEYIIGSPLFDKATIHLQNGKTFVIESKQGKNTIYVNGLQLNNKEYNKTYISHNDIMQGGVLKFDMSNKVNKTFGKAKQSRPYQVIEEKIEILPYLEYKGTGTFTDKLQISYNHLSHNYKEITDKKQTITSTLHLREVFKKYDTKNDIVFQANIVQIPKGRKIKLLTSYSPLYTGGGNEALIDLKQGGTNWKLGAFQGYWGENVEAIIDLGSKQEVKQIGGNFAQEQKAWIFMPTKVEYYVSEDGKNFTLFETINNTIDEKEEQILIHTFFTTKPMNTRYIKMKAYNRMTNPSWHLSAGEKSWLFIDEIIIK
ncbi:MAG: GH92 family glycosyl hydrolase [Bacteroidota bacterium]|nr:GH92 family glycosyl hydrolase [Bacteroidota bacterium]